MTCIVGFIKNGKVYMGGDSAGVEGLSITKRKDTKVFNNNGFLIGYTSSFRMGQLLRFSFKPPVIPCGMDLYEYMCTLFIDEVRKILAKGGYSKINNNSEEGGTFLVGIAGKLFEISDDFQVGESLKNYESCGCGKRFALGCLSATTTLLSTYSPEQHIQWALEAAEEFSSGVCKPFNIISE